MTTSLRTDEQLRGALDKLEQCLETPILSGHMDEWLCACRQLWIDVESALQMRIDEGHGEMLEEIAAQDPELLPRIEKLLAEDSILLKAASELRNDADWLAAACKNQSSDQQRVDEQLQRFSKRALEWVLRIRAQETAIMTWYQEAFNRDRGVGD